MTDEATCIAADVPYSDLCEVGVNPTFLLSFLNYFLKIHLLAFSKYLLVFPTFLLEFLKYLLKIYLLEVSTFLLLKK